MQGYVVIAAPSAIEEDASSSGDGACDVTRLADGAALPRAASTQRKFRHDEPIDQNLAPHWSVPRPGLRHRRGISEARLAGGRHGARERAIQAARSFGQERRAAGDRDRRYRRAGTGRSAQSAPRQAEFRSSVCQCGRALGPPMSVRTQPGAISSIVRGSSAWRALKLRMSMFSAALLAR